MVDRAVGRATNGLDAADLAVGERPRQAVQLVDDIGVRAELLDVEVLEERVVLLRSRLGK